MAGAELSAAALRGLLTQSQANGTDLLVLMIVALHQDTPSALTLTQEQIATLAGVSDRRVRRSLARLQELGELRVQYKGSGHPQGANTNEVPDAARRDADSRVQVDADTDVHIDADSLAAEFQRFLDGR